jgi:hypothetical protein
MRVCIRSVLLERDELDRLVQSLQQRSNRRTVTVPCSGMALARIEFAITRMSVAVVQCAMAKREIGRAVRSCASLDARSAE